MRELSQEELYAVFGGARVVDTSILPTPQYSPGAEVRLTPRQAQCLAWVAAGKTSAEIGVIIGLSPQSVDTYAKAACRALGVRTRAEAVAILTRNADAVDAAKSENGDENQSHSGEIR